MELTDSNTIASLISVRSVAPQKTSRSLSHAGNARTNRHRICTCGSCFACLDNAKWERIFREKFEDPSYYEPHVRRGGSSCLGSE